MLGLRIGIILALPLKEIETMSLQAKLRDIGRMEGATPRARDQNE